MPVDPATRKALAAAANKAAAWTAERDRLIQQAVVEEGGSLREVGAIAKLSHTAVRFIVRRRAR